MLRGEAIMGDDEVVITGTGVVSPLGRGTEVLWSGLLAGATGIRPITHFDASDLATRFAGEVDDATCADVLPRRVTRRLDRSAVMALVAATEALAQARLDTRESGAGSVAPERVATCLGTSSGPLQHHDDVAGAFADGGPEALRRRYPLASSTTSPSIATSEVARHFDLRGPSSTVVAECASGALAVGTALMLLRAGAADVVVCGGVDATVTARSLVEMSVVGALSRRNDDPGAACRPFDRDRDGFVLGEGAAVLVLERASHARSRGVPALGVLHGFGAATDTAHATAPAPDGDGAARALRAALDDAGRPAADVGVVSAHGTGTELNDSAEAAALLRVLGPTVRDVPVHSIKPATGHMIAASGAAEVIVLALTLANGLVPATANCPSPAFDHLDVVRDAPRPTAADLGVSLSFGFGGQSIALVVGAPDRSGPAGGDR